MTVRNKPTLSPGAREWIKCNKHTAEKLPDVKETWSASEAGLDRGQVERLQWYGLIERVGRIGPDTNEYRTCEKAWNAVQNIDHREDSMLPCGHNAFENERDVEGVTCKRCGDVHDKSEVER